MRGKDKCGAANRQHCRAARLGSAKPGARANAGEAHLGPPHTHPPPAQSRGHCPPAVQGGRAGLRVRLAVGAHYNWEVACQKLPASPATNAPRHAATGPAGSPLAADASS